MIPPAKPLSGSYGAHLIGGCRWRARFERTAGPVKGLLVDNFTTGGVPRKQLIFGLMMENFSFKNPFGLLGDTQTGQCHANRAVRVDMVPARR